MGEKKLPTIERLHELFYVDEAGNLVRKYGPWHSLTSAGDIAGSINAWGHLKVRVDYQMLYNHRVVWAMTYGEWPDRAIDHINGIKTDNRPCNLRLATDMQNSHNRGLTKRNTTGYRGVCFEKRSGKYLAQIRVAGKQYRLGTFDNPKDASEAYEEAAKELHGESYRDMENAA